MTAINAADLVTIHHFFFQAEDGIRDADVTGVQTCALPISTESTDPKVIRAAMGDALKSMDVSYNPYEVTEVTENGGFVTRTTLAVVKDGKIVREEIEK